MKILIAEDTEDSRVLLELLLVAEGYEVMSGTNGIEALELARANPPDLIISDIMMPELDGFDLCRLVKADPMLKNIPFIFYTATYTDKQDKQLGLALGASKFIIKPMNSEKLIRIIQEFITTAQSKEILIQKKPQSDQDEIDYMHFDAVSRKLDKKVRQLEKERKSLEQSEKKYRHLVESVQNYFFFYTHDTEGVFTFISPSIKILLGYSPDEFLVHYSKYLTNNPINNEAINLFDLSIKGEEQAPFEVEINHKIGLVSWLEIKEVPIFDHNGKVIQIDGIAHDITERKKTEYILRRSEKMDALDKLTGGIAHDYNNMLGVILGYAELLENVLSEQPKLANYTHEIQRAAERGTKLSRKLLAFTQHKSSDAESLNINSLLQEEKNMLEKSLTARIQLALNLEDDLWHVWLDSSDLEDAILNISLNAMHAMGKSGQLTIQTSNQKINKIDAQQLDLKPGDYVLLSITDTGCGMDKATEEKIFDPFYTTKGEKGTGLGLSQVYGFVQRSKGAIKVYSELEQGTRFNLYFPRYIGIKSKNQQSTTKDVDNLSGMETILVVDDEPALLNLTAEILTQQGYNIHCAQNAKQALKVLGRESIELLLSDVIMPDMGGYELATIVQNKYPRIKILLASGFSNNGHVNMFDENLYQNLLQKPYNSQTLLRKIRELLD